MFFEITAVMPTLLWGLDAQCWNFTDEREFGLWVNVERWEGLLAQAGFQRVRCLLRVLQHERCLQRSASTDEATSCL